MSTAFKDYYQVLGISKTASEDDIRKEYRNLARKHHPDLNPGDKSAEDKFKEINEAYEVLSDSGKRKQYDQLGPDSHAGAALSIGQGALTGMPAFVTAAILSMVNRTPVNLVTFLKACLEGVALRALVPPFGWLVRTSTPPYI